MTREHEIDFCPTMLRQIRPDAFVLPAEPTPSDPAMTRRDVSKVIEATTYSRLLGGERME